MIWRTVTSHIIYKQAHPGIMVPEAICSVRVSFHVSVHLAKLFVATLARAHVSFLSHIYSTGN
jgi:hypothetical protein